VAWSAVRRSRPTASWGSSRRASRSASKSCDRLERGGRIAVPAFFWSGRRWSFGGASRRAFAGPREPIAGALLGTQPDSFEATPQMIIGANQGL